MDPLLPTGAGHYLTLSAESTAEVREKASRFIAYAFPIADQAAFKERLAAIAREHPSARHICFGWVLGKSGGTWRAFDAGEPAGTAGRPILRQIQAARLTHSAIVVVRYFGGTLLGKAGLAKAFAAAAREALARGTMVRHRPMEQLEVRCGYGLVEEVKRTVHHHSGEVLHAAYGDGCMLRIALPAETVADLREQWARAGAVVSTPAEH